MAQCARPYGRPTPVLKLDDAPAPDSKRTAICPHASRIVTRRNTARPRSPASTGEGSIDMKVTTTMLAATALLCCSAAFAQESSYKPGTVWNFSYVKIE